MKENLLPFIFILLQLLTHLNLHLKQSKLQESVDNYVVQERNSRIILSCDLLSRIDNIEHNIKNIMDENLTVIREETEYNLGVLEVISDVLKEHNIELE